jgi:hypothetical protein
VTLLPMSKPISKSKAVLNVLGRLGFHTKASEVVAALHEYGITVSEGLVQKVPTQLSHGHG